MKELKTELAELKTEFDMAAVADSFASFFADLKVCCTYIL